MRAGLLVNVFLLWFSSAINVPRQGAGVKESAQNEPNFSLGPTKEGFFPFPFPFLPFFSL